MRVQRVDPSSPGWSRRRAGPGFVYLDAEGTRIADPKLIGRCKALAIPPAWREVWICPTPAGHIQAVGTDDAGRRQYLYHDRWQERRSRRKFQHVLGIARELPEARASIRRELTRTGMPRGRALAVAFALLDRGYFRIGGESYAQRNGSFGLATLRKAHVRIRRDGSIHFDYAAKSGIRRSLMLADDDLLAPVAMLRRRRAGTELLAYRQGRQWHDITSADINDHLKELLGSGASAKDFRTWHATVDAALALARADRGELGSARRRAEVVRAAVGEVAEQLGNTPAVCRSSYIDPQVIDLFERGHTVPWSLAERVARERVTDELRNEVEQEVLTLLE